ncbi:MAG: glycosyltransferase [Actinomycetales bacterium]|nr:glycosyltransferase [Actinomycetales bacterium]
MHESIKISGQYSAPRQTEAAIRALRDSAPERVLVVKGDLLGQRWWEAVQAEGVPSALWLYDELSNMSYSSETLKSIAKVASYSEPDTVALRESGIDAQYVPLGFDSLLRYTQKPDSQLSFVGARYPARENYLQKISMLGVPVKAYGRAWSRRPIDIVRSGFHRHPGFEVGQELDRSTCYGVMAGSVATINLHAGHYGFNMRAFEAPGVGGLQLIDRLDIQKFFDVGTEALVFSHEEEVAGLFHRAVRDTAWAERIRVAGQRRALAEHTLVHRMGVLESLWD